MEHRYLVGLVVIGCVLVEQVEKKVLVVLVSCMEGRKAEMMRLLSKVSARYSDDKG